MRMTTVRRQALTFAGGFVTAIALVSGVLFAGVLPGMQSHAVAKSGPSNYLPQHTNLNVSSIRYADQYFLHDHLGQTQKVQAALKAAHVTAHPTGQIGIHPSTTVNGGAQVLNSDPYVFTQNEESYAIDPATVPASGQLGIVGVAGYNDFRGFFLAANTGSGYAVSKNVSCTAGTCAQLMKDGWLPAITDPLCSDGSLLMPAGDPSLAAVNGTFYFSSLAAYIPRSGSANCGQSDNGIIVSKSNANLENAAVTCNDALTTNNCWTSTLVHESQLPSGCAFTSEPCQFDDKDWLTVDPASGNVTIAWDILDDDVGTEIVVASVCNASLSCSAASKVSVPPAQCNVSPCDDTFGPYLATWHNPNTGNNDTILTYDQFNTYCPPVGACNFNVDLHIADLQTHSDQIFDSLPPYQMLDGALADDQFRMLTQAKVAADYRSVANPQIYVTWDQCKFVSNPSDGTGDGASYYSIYNIYGGSCAQAQVRAFNFTSPTATPTAMPVQGGWDQVMPSIAVDEFGSNAGHVALAYYSTQGDSVANALIRPYAATSTGGTAGFNTSTYSALNTINNRYTADPAFAFGIVGPLLGDYMQVAVANGGLFVNFTANYVQKSGPSFLGTVLVAQQDNYLCYIQPGTAFSSTSACASA